MQLHRARPQLSEVGVTLVVIGNGTPNFMEGFRDKTGYDGPLYTDPSLEAYKAFELRRDVRSSLNLRSLGKAISAYRGGNRQTATKGDPWQQGGVFVVSKDGELLFRYVAQFAGDKPTLDSILASAREAGAS